MYLYDSKDVSKNTKFHLWHIRKEISAEVERPFAEDQSRHLGRVMSEKIRWPAKSLKFVDFYFYVDNHVNFFWGPYFYTQKNWVAEFGWYYVFFSEFFTEMLRGSRPFYGLLDAIKTPPTDINWLSSWSCLGILESIKFEHRSRDDNLTTFVQLSGSSSKKHMGIWKTQGVSHVVFGALGSCYGWSLPCGECECGNVVAFPHLAVKRSNLKHDISANYLLYLSNLVYLGLSPNFSSS